MARLSYSFKLGTTSPSSLIKSAATIQKQFATLQDTLAKDQYLNSGYTDASFTAYSQYLNERIATLSNSSSVTDQAKLASLNQELITASHQNMSYQIQQENLALMQAGESNTSAGDYAKMQIIQQQFDRANSIGDQTLALQLQNQYASLSQSYQSKLQTEQTAAQSAYTAGVTQANANVKSALENLSQNIKEGNAGNLQQVLSSTRDTLNTYYKQTTGQDLPSGSQITLGGLVQAAYNVMFQNDYNTAVSLQSVNPTEAAKYAVFDNNGNIIGGSAGDILNGTTTLKVMGTDINAQTAEMWANNPAAFRVDTTGGVTSLAKNPVVDYQMVNGQVQPVYTGTNPTPLSKDQIANYTKLLTKAGFGTSKANFAYNADTNTFTVQLNNKTDAWTQWHNAQNDLSSSSPLGVGNELTFTVGSNGILKAVTSSGRLVNLIFDNAGHAGLYQTNTSGHNVPLAGQYGFNQNAISQQINQGQAINQLPTAGQVRQTIFKTPAYQMTQRAGGGFDFSLNGQAISAATYSQGTGIGFRDLLNQMATKGDSGAKAALGFVGNDYKFDPSKIKGNEGLYSALTWGSKSTLTPSMAPSGSSTSPFTGKSVTLQSIIGGK